LARIVESGEVAVGDSVELLEVVEPEPVTPGA
jgi:MOSC domain-containing protein YiiM